MAPDKLVIRAMEPEDARACSELANGPGVIWGTLQIPYTAHAFRATYLGEPASPDRQSRLVAERDSMIVGLAGLHVRDRRERHSASLGMSVRDDYQGQGIGTELLQVLLDVADNWLGLIRIDLQVYIDNERAIALYKRMGFEVEGTHRKAALRGGQYADTYTMARLHEAPR